MHLVELADKNLLYTHTHTHPNKFIFSCVKALGKKKNLNDISFTIILFHS